MVNYIYSKLSKASEHIFWVKESYLLEKQRHEKWSQSGAAFRELLWLPDAENTNYSLPANVSRDLGLLINGL